jgi:hypothetical protein
MDQLLSAQAGGHLAASAYLISPFILSARHTPDINMQVLQVLQLLTGPVNPAPTESTSALLVFLHSLMHLRQKGCSHAMSPNRLSPGLGADRTFSMQIEHSTWALRRRAMSLAWRARHSVSWAERASGL